MLHIPAGLKSTIWKGAKAVVQNWTKQELRQCSLYGIRIYTEGSVLNTHVDRLPLVSSAIINVDQDLDEPWPLEVIGHDGNAHNGKHQLWFNRLLHTKF